MKTNKILNKLYHGQYLNYSENEKLFHSIIYEKLTPLQITSVLISMKIRGESYEEIASAANVLLKIAKPFPHPQYPFADISGTGGDKNKTINISTTSAIVAASCGLKIIKHGNHNISGHTGSADLLSGLNIKLNVSIQQSLKSLQQAGICFLYAPQYHPILKHVQKIRQDLKTPTLFNILGPLINPAKPPLAIIGVYKPELLLPVALTVKQLKYHHTAIIAHCDGTDEIGLHAPTKIAEFHKGKIQQYTLTASDFGLKNQKKNVIITKSKQENIDSILKLLQGQGKTEHEYVIAANVAMLLKLFGNNNLIDNTHRALEAIHEKTAYKNLLELQHCQQT
ncbi:anthranilate phosphoribosyltransferase [Blochmannia endosymbiont of Polyrhachis (Hedomyrma) turneri]|uniref:anthranilate phosphoribosyltransferase n=1 Tax=Blochmannia endosymbiont of Polyrhachis (Hedomyrma) turneri TaxID=1505596 RepID=UPI00061A7CCD|nr:anthranilate phosphoribosyltransferase [Blochmannia endosymbiont of Polyrhachis (Hedomyrma) turneri]AKC59989.1 anthranilate phosphoribosyltransferase [Blochmannia endosymbiont of Polyrhachis (Hedomyrma) turneri]